MATVPGCVHLDLQSAGVIQDPYYRYNYLDYRWIAQNDWSYSTTFSYSQGQLYLNFHGLDSVAAVYINSRKIMDSCNQFVGFLINVTDACVKGSNSILIKFTSALKYAVLLTYSETASRLVPLLCPGRVSPRSKWRAASQLYPQRAMLFCLGLGSLLCNLWHLEAH